MKKISLISAMLAFCPNLQAMQSYSYMQYPAERQLTSRLQAVQSYSYMQYPAERQLTPCLQAIPNQVYDWVFAAGVDLFHKVRAVMRLSDAQEIEYYAAGLFRALNNKLSSLDTEFYLREMFEEMGRAIADAENLIRMLRMTYQPPNRELYRGEMIFDNFDFSPELFIKARQDTEEGIIGVMKILDPLPQKNPFWEKFFRNNSLRNEIIETLLYSKSRKRRLSRGISPFSRDATELPARPKSCDIYINVGHPPVKEGKKGKNHANRTYSLIAFSDA